MELNQLYRQNATFRDYPHIEATYKEITEYLKNRKALHKTGRAVGRIYDQAVLYHTPGIDFKGKKVCEVGGRDGGFASWLTGICEHVTVSDYFELWGKGTEHDLGSYDYWKDRWLAWAVNPERLSTGIEDITKLSYPDNHFDITICTSVIEHMYPQNFNKGGGDISGIRELVRITKPGGYILLSTDMTTLGKSGWYSGTYFYDEVDLFDRIIGPSRCELVGPYNFDFNHPDNNEITYFNRIGAKIGSVVFALKKGDKLSP